MLTAALFSRLSEKSHHTLVRSHCRCASDGTVLNAYLVDDGRPVATCVVFFALVVLSWSSANMEGLQSVYGACGEGNRVDSDTRNGGASTTTPTHQQVLMPSVINTTLLEQTAAFDGNRTKWADWAFTFSNCKRTQHSHGSSGWSTLKAR